MRHVAFEYTDAKSARRLIAFCLIGFFLLPAIWEATAGSYQSTWPLLLITAVVIFLAFRHKAREAGHAYFHDSGIRFDLAGPASRTIQFADITSYLIELRNGTKLEITLQNGETFKLQASGLFCNTHAFDSFCRRFERTLVSYQATCGKTIIRRKSIFEQAWMLPAILLITAASLMGVAYFISGSRKPPAVFYLSIVITLSLWQNYLAVRENKREFGDI